MDTLKSLTAERSILLEIIRTTQLQIAEVDRKMNVTRKLIQKEKDVHAKLESFIEFIGRTSGEFIFSQPIYPRDYDMKQQKGILCKNIDLADALTTYKLYPMELLTYTATLNTVDEKYYLSFTVNNASTFASDYLDFIHKNVSIKIYLPEQLVYTSYTTKVESCNIGELIEVPFRDSYYIYIKYMNINIYGNLLKIDVIDKETLTLSDESKHITNDFGIIAYKIQKVTKAKK